VHPVPGTPGASDLPAGEAAEQAGAGAQTPTETRAADDGSSPLTLVGVALLAALVTAALLMGLPALRRRRERSTSSDAAEAPDARLPVSSGRTGP
jgi:hypothetical protein